MRRIFLVALLGLAVFAATAPAQAAKRIALVIGNSNYENVGALANPENDAQAMAEVLGEVGFEVILKTNVDYRGMSRAIRDFGKLLRSAGRDTVALFFYAGHGVQASDTNYLLPIGAEVDAEPDLVGEAVNANWVLSQMESASNGLNIVILDACRNNPFSGSSFRSASRGLARLDAPTGSLIAYSAGPGEVAADGRDANSPYTKALVAAMRRPGLELLSMFRQVRIAVEEETRGNQTPWEEQSLRGDFFFTPPVQNAAVPSNQGGATGTTPTQSQPGANPAADIAFWNTVKDSNNPDELQAYLDAYPDGRFRALAQIRIAHANAAESAGTAIPDESTVEDSRGRVSVNEEGGLRLLGMTVENLNADLRNRLGIAANVEGLVVTEVANSSVAWERGISPGSVIVDVNHTVVAALSDLATQTTRLAADGRPSALMRVVDPSSGSPSFIAFPLSGLTIDQVGRVPERSQSSGGSSGNSIQQGGSSGSSIQQGGSSSGGQGQSLGGSQQGQSLGGGSQGQSLGSGNQQQALVDPDQQSGSSLSSTERQAEEWFQIGEQYYYGNDRAQNYAEAINWYRKAAEYDHAEALFSLGWVYAEGQGVTKDMREAARWYRRGASTGHASSQFQLGYLYDIGEGVGQDDREAVKLYRQAAAGGIAGAKNNLAIMLDEARGTARDPAGAARNLVEAYVAGYEASQTWLFEKADQWAVNTRREIQKLLQRSGHYTGPIDGGIGPASRRALESYRRANGG